MPPAKKKTKTTTTEKVPAAAAAGRSLTDLNDETLERVASFLSPPSVYNLARASKKTFWAERDDGAPPLGTTLAQAALRRQLARVVRAVTRRRAPRDDGRPAFELMDVFPDELVPKDAREAPRALLSGSVAVQAAIGVGGDETEDEEEDEDEEEVEDNDDDDDDDDDDGGGGDDDDDDDDGGDDDDDDDEKEPWAGADFDVFCTFEAAPFVRRRLIERCGIVCSGVDNDYMQQRSDADYDAPGSSLNAISHVESYSARPTSGVTTDRGAFYTLVPIRPRRRGERRSLRILPGVSLRPGSLAHNPRPCCLSTPLLTPFNSTPISSLCRQLRRPGRPVSYTHLTLPTKA